MRSEEHRDAINWVDAFTQSEQQLILTNRELPIPGLRTFGLHNRRCASAALPPHYHENCIELTFVLQGSVLFYTGGTEYEIFGGDAFLTQPDVVHSTNEAPLSVCELFWVQLDTSDPDNFLYLAPPAARALIDALHAVSEPHICTDNNGLRRAVNALAEAALHRSRPEDVYRVAADLVFFLYQLLPFVNRPTNRVSQDISRCCGYIQEHLHTELTLQQLAELSGLSVSQFKYKFKTQIGAAPRNYINQLKIEQIKKQIVPGVVFAELASEYGFCSSAYFSVVFKKYAGMTPSEYLASQTAQAKKREK